MNLSIVFAMGSMLCAGVNDLVFKRYVSKIRSKGTYLSLIGVVWGLIFYVASLSSGGLKADINTVIYGIICGLFSITAQILLLESLHGIDAGTGSTIYRLNFVVVVILAPVFLGELLTPLRLVGSLLAVVSVLLLFLKGNAAPKRHHLHRFSFLYLAIIASILRGLMGFFYKVALNHDIEANTFLFVNSVLWIVGGFIYAALWERNTSVSRKIVAYSCVSGFLVAGILLFLLMGVRSGEAIIVVPISQLSFIVTGALSVWLLKERMTFLKIIAIISAVGTIFCLSFSN